MTTGPTRMRQEIGEIPDALERLLSRGEEAVRNTAAEIREADPRFGLSVARGSSDHACAYLKYACELILRRPMASVGPSVASVYGVGLKAAGMLCLAVSQSGQSPDIIGMTQSLHDGGALTVAITNDPVSPLAGVAGTTLPIHAGPELSVAATKTFVNSLVAGLWLLAEIAEDDDLLGAICGLPRHLEEALTCDWSAAANAIGQGTLFTLGRGPSYAIAKEAALKLKETCAIHAECHSSAEVLHGPVSLVDEGFPIIAFAAADAAEAGLAETADTLSDAGARVFAVTDRVTRATRLPHVRTGHWLTDPVAAVVSFYVMVEDIARRRGIDPDRPRHLRKVTQTT